jgi:hypothetical protein
MSRRVLRAAIAASIALALLVLVRPARASSAPFCDDRGASAIASPPLLEAPDDAIRRASLVSCDTEEPLLFASIAPAHRGPARGLASPEAAIEGRRVSLARPLGQLLPAQRARIEPLPEGVGFRIERPPRG